MAFLSVLWQTLKAAKTNRVAEGIILEKLSKKLRLLCTVIKNCLFLLSVKSRNFIKVLFVKSKNYSKNAFYKKQNEIKNAFYKKQIKLNRYGTVI